MTDNFDEIAGITVAIGFLVIFLWGQYVINKTSKQDFSEDKK